MVSVVLPPDDGSIQQALAELETRMTAWTAAMSDAQAVLRESARQHGIAMPAEAAAPAAPEKPVQPEPAAPAATAPSEPPVKPSVPQIRKDRAVMAVSSGPAKKSGKPRPATEEAPAAEEPALKPQPEARPAVAAPAPPGSEAALREDEALLASLDEETANAIRVMRRMDFGRRSVAELLKEYEMSRGASKPSGSKGKSWWSRGKG